MTRHSPGISRGGLLSLPSYNRTFCAQNQRSEVFSGGARLHAAVTSHKELRVADLMLVLECFHFEMLRYARVSLFLACHLVMLVGQGQYLYSDYSVITVVP